VTTTERGTQAPGAEAPERSKPWTGTWDLITTKNLEIRKRRGLMITLILVTVGIPTVFLAIRLLLVFWTVMSAAGLIVEGLFALAGQVPGRPHGTVADSPLSWNYTTFLNLGFLVVLAGPQMGEMHVLPRGDWHKFFRRGTCGRVHFRTGWDRESRCPGAFARSCILTLVLPDCSRLRCPICRSLCGSCRGWLRRRSWPRSCWRCLPACPS